MKNYLFFLCIIFSAYISHSQVTTDDYATKVADSKLLTNRFITIGCGINANFGVIGCGVELPLSKKITIAGGMGISSWGYKGHGEIKFYVKEDYEGFSFGLGIGRNSGLKNLEMELETAPDKINEMVKMDLKPVTSVSFSATQAWRLGRSRQHKFFVQSGIVARTTDNLYYVKSDHKLSPSSISVLKTIAPGGVILGIGFSFGL